MLHCSSQAAEYVFSSSFCEAIPLQHIVEQLSTGKILHGQYIVFRRLKCCNKKQNKKKWIYF